MPRHPLAKTAPFPWKCGQCRQRTVHPATVPYTVEAEHDGRSYTLAMPDLKTPRCQNCGELVLDSAANRQISEALRQQLGLLSPEQIRTNREALGLTQRHLAGRLGIAEATLSRWETGGQIQQRALDRLLRLYFAFDAVRAALAEDQVADLGGPAEIAAPTPLSRLAVALDSLPDAKRASAVEEFQRLVELMK